MPRTLSTGSGWIIASLWAFAAVAPVVAEPCCLPDGRCQNIDPGLCQHWGGLPHPGIDCLGDRDQNGLDDACEPQLPQACCLSDGACILVPGEQCTWLGGTASRGDGCLGDANGNGHDDACDSEPSETRCLVGDLNADGAFDARDLQPFIDVITGIRADEASMCAANLDGSLDIYGNHTLDAADVSLMVAGLAYAGTDAGVLFTVGGAKCDTKKKVIIESKDAEDVIVHGKDGNGPESDCPVNVRRRAVNGADIAGSDCTIDRGGAKRVKMGANQELLIWCDAGDGKCLYSINRKPAAAQPGEATCP